MKIDLSQFNEAYLEEATEHLHTLEDGLLELEKTNTGDLNAIFRAAHSIKGGAGTFGFEAIAAFTHNLEGVLDKAREGFLTVDAALAATFLEAVDVLREMIDAAKQGAKITEGFGDDVAAQLATFLDGNLESAVATPEDTGENFRMVTITFAPKPHLLQTGSDPLNIFKELQSLGVLKVKLHREGLPEMVDYNPENLYYRWTLTLETNAPLSEIKDVFIFVETDADLAYSEHTPETPTTADLTPLPERRHEDRRQQDRRTPEEQHPAALREAAYIRVETGKVDSLINLVGELVTTGAMVTQHSCSLDRDRHDDLHKAVAEMTHHTRNMQEAIMAIRMMPVSFVFNRFPRMVRDTAAKLGKKVELKTIGDHTELDKTVIERMVDPLTHLVRNAIDHGVEKVADRKAQGKDEMATVRLAARYQGGNVVIEISDDGQGLNRERILAKAIEKGLAESKNTYTDDEVWQFIFQPGFSTAAEVTDVSGRGVGMDVVRRNIQSLGGAIRVESTKGKGSTFTISLPLTLAILDGMAIELAKTTYILPILSIVESVRPTVKTVRKMQNSLEVIDFRGEYLPFVRLCDVFGLNSATPLEEGIAIIVEAENQHFALFIDDLLGERQVVIKNIEDNYKIIEGISGATILGDGSVSLILDLAGIIRKATREGLFAKPNPTYQQPQPPIMEATHEHP